MNDIIKTVEHRIALAIYYILAAISISLVSYCIADTLKYFIYGSE